MPLESLLVANRGEIAIRVMRAAAARGLRSVAVYSEDEAGALHTRKADAAQPLRGSGAAAYLDIDGIVAAARAAGCDALHPGYGFLSENAELARRCTAAGLTFVGPTPEALERFGDKARARSLAQQCGIPVLEGTSGPTSLEAARALLARFGAGASLMIKAVAGGGGRGVRPVHSEQELEKAFERCASEAAAAFGSGDLYVERWLPRARHVEVQVAGDATGAVVHFAERECSLQRRHQKLVEIAPAPWLSPALRERVHAAAVVLARAAHYAGLGTVEFLVDADAPESFYFIEANARLQVEHTVTEAVTGIDLVALQLDLAEGRSLAELGLAQEFVPAPRGYAIQLRVNTEKLRAKDGLALPASGTLTAFEPPEGPGVRTDTAGHVGYASNPRFDSLLAKVIVHSASPRFADLLPRAARALAEFRIEGIETNRGLLLALLRHPAVARQEVTTRFVEQHAAELVAAAAQPQPRLYLESTSAEPVAPAPARTVGAAVDPGDPLAVLAHGKSAAPAASAPAPQVSRSPQGREAAAQRGEAERSVGPRRDGKASEGHQAGAVAVRAPLSGTVASLAVGEGDAVAVGRALLVLESMKMEHVIEADRSGIVRALAAACGETVAEGQPLVWLEEAEVASGSGDAAPAVDPASVRADLAEVVERHALGFDERRPDAVARRRKTGQRTARENVEDLCDPGSFIEYGPLAIAAQRRRRTLEDLTRRTPADGLIAGIGSVNGEFFQADRARCAVLAYDYTVLAGTQGIQNHRKKDRLFELAASWRLPVVIFTEGGGGRPGDTDGTGVAGLDCTTFHDFGALSGLVPLVAINSGRCFAGNAALLGCCDVVIATANSNIGMGGPAMIEGGGLGVFRPEEVGPIDVQVQNGVVDLPVEDEAEAVAVAKRYLGYFQGPLARGESADPRLLRHVIPENRLRVYDVRRAISGIADTGSVLELRRAFGRGMVTALVRIEGAAVGVIANNPTHLSGAIDSDGADKATRFMQLCDAFDLPILFLCDTPGIMVGPEVEKTALVRHAARMFVTAGSLTVPFFTIVLRKGYGLGAQAMAGGSFKAPLFCVSWPTGEFGGMGLEGAVKLGYRGELAALEQPEQRRALFQQMVDRMYEVGKAVNMSSVFEIDDVIDPADSRRWIVRALASVPPPAPRTGKKRPCIDPW